MKTLDINHLTKRYSSSSNYAINDISFSCESGKIYGFFGPNGSGKTTTINIVSTMLAPTSGDVYVCGYSIRKDRDSIRKLIGLSAQKQSINWFLNVFQNIDVYSSIKNKRVRHNKIEE